MEAESRGLLLGEDAAAAVKAVAVDRKADACSVRAVHAQLVRAAVSGQRLTRALRLPSGIVSTRRSSQSVTAGLPPSASESTHWRGRSSLLRASGSSILPAICSGTPSSLAT